jgi:hypothetical protein
VEAPVSPPVKKEIPVISTFDASLFLSLNVPLTGELIVPPVTDTSVAEPNPVTTILLSKLLFIPKVSVPAFRVPPVINGNSTGLADNVPYHANAISKSLLYVTPVTADTPTLNVVVSFMV